MMFLYHMAQIPISGGAGYVGGRCAKALGGAGHEGVVFDNLSLVITSSYARDTSLMQTKGATMRH